MGVLRRRTLLALPSVLALPATGASAAADAAAPRIADLWYAHNAVVVMLGGAPLVVVTVARPESFPWMYRVAPSLSRATVVLAGAANAEALLAAGVTLAFVSNPAEADRLAALGIRALPMGFADLPALLDAIDRTAAAMDTELARQRAAEYRAYLQEVIQRLDARLAGVAEADRPSVLHLVSPNPLRVDGADTIIDTWIRLAGGRNVARELRGNMQPVSVEQIAAWAPEVIIAGGADRAATPTSPLWGALPAVRAGRVLRNPAGVFPWDRYGTEFALQVQWAAKRLHPRRFADLDLQAETRSFYRRFFAFDLSPTDAELILAGKPPA